MQEIPVYLFTGFMDSGKTTLIKETLFENDFGGDNRTVIIVCEDGDEEYDEAKLNTINAKVAMIEEQEDFTTETLQKIQETYKPEQIFIEYNGTWDIATLLETKMPDGWVIVQFAVQRQSSAIVRQIVCGGPISRFNGIRRALQGVHRHGQGVDVVFEIQAVGQRVVQCLLQRLEAVGVVPGVEGVERDFHQQAVHLIAGIQHVIGQVQCFF